MQEKKEEFKGAPRLNTYGRRSSVSSWLIRCVACDLCKLCFMGTASCPQEDSNH